MGWGWAVINSFAEILACEATGQTQRQRECIHILSRETVDGKYYCPTCDLVTEYNPYKRGPK